MKKEKYISLLKVDLDENNYNKNFREKNNNKNSLYRKNIKLKIKIINNNCNLIKCSLISFLLLFAIILLIEKILKMESKNISILFNIAIQIKNDQNKTDLYNKENNKTNNISNNQKEKEEEKPKQKDYVFKTLTDSFNTAKDFLDKCIKGILIQDKQKFILLENPLISVVIPLYNCQNFILRTLRSIQNQNIYNLEIILVNDFSTDGSVSVIEDIKIKDPRIKLINNKKNMGTLYSRSIGVLAAKGKYIFPLDNDDMFLDKDVFEIITNIAESENHDIVEFKGVESLRGSTDILQNKIKDISFSNKKLNLIMHQPELGKYPIRPNINLNGYNLFDVYVWAKCIKTEMYQKAINNLGKEKYSRFMLAHEDVVMMYILFYTIESFKFVGKYGIFHIKRGGSAWEKSGNVYMDLKELLFLDVVIDFPKNSKEGQKLAVYIMINILNSKGLEKMLNDKEYNKKLFYYCLDRIFNSTLITNEQKNEIRNKEKTLQFLNYTF